MLALLRFVLVHGQKFQQVQKQYIIVSDRNHSLGQKSKSRAVFFYNYLCNQCLLSLNVESSNPSRGDVHTIQHYVIKFVSDSRQISGFHRVLRTLHQYNWPPLLKVALNTISRLLTSNQRQILAPVAAGCFTCNECCICRNDVLKLSTTGTKVEMKTTSRVSSN